jgi:hypothetical protein
MLPSLGTSVHHVSVPATSPPGTHGVAERFMAALASVGVNVILTSQEGAGHFKFWAAAIYPRGKNMVV